MKFLFLNIFYRETFSLELFHSIEVFIQRCYEMIRVDKKQNKLWAKRMHTSLKCYKENLIFLYSIEKKLKEHNEKNDNDSNLNATNKQLNNINLNSNNNQDEELIDLDDFSKPTKKLIDLSSSSKTNISQSNNIENTQIDKSLLDEKSIYLLTKLKGNI